MPDSLMKTKFAFVFFFFAQVINIRLDEIVTSIVTARSLPARSRGREFQNEGGKTSRHETQCCGGVVFRAKTKWRMVLPTLPTDGANVS